jgi:Tol biopolymer transport system component
MTRAAFFTSLLIHLAVAGFAAAQAPITPTTHHLFQAPQLANDNVIELPTGLFLLGGGDNDRLVVMDHAGHMVCTLPGRFDNVSVSRDGGRIAFNRFDNDKQKNYVWTQLLDVHKGTPVGDAHRVSIRVAEEPQISPDGKRIAYTRGSLGPSSDTLFVIPATGGDERRITVGRNILNLRWTPDGSWIYYVDAKDGAWAVYRISSTGGSPQRVSDGTRMIGFSSDGKYFAAYGRNTFPFGSDKVAIQIRSPGGSLITEFTWTNRAQWPQWSTTAPHEMVAGEISLHDVLKQVSLPDGRITTLPSLVPEQRSPAFLTNDQIAFVGLSEGRHWLYISDLAGRGKRVATRAEPRFGNMFPSPNGQYVVFFSEAPGRAHIINLRTGSDIDIPQSPPGRVRWLSSGNGLLNVVGGAHPSISLIDLNGRSTVLAQPDSADFFARIAYVVNDTLVALTDRNGLYLYSVNERKLRTAYPGPTSGLKTGAILGISHDGSMIGFSVLDHASGRSQAAVYSLKTNKTQLIGRPMGCGAGVIGFDLHNHFALNWVYDKCEPDEIEGIDLAPLDGGPVRDLTPAENGNVGETVLSPDGTRALFVARQGKPSTTVERISIPGVH